MAAPASASSSLFIRLADIWRIVSLRSDVDNIILELLGKFSLEKIYSEGDKETYQQLVIALLAQLNAIYYIQRLSLPCENVQVGWYLGFLASWEVTLRSVEFVLQTVLEGRENLWEAPQLRDKYLAEVLLSTLRILTLHPKAPQRAKDRRDRFARIHRLLEGVFDNYPEPKSFLLLVCKDMTNTLRKDPDALPLPPKLRYELPNLASELYPLADCLSSQHVATLVPQDGFPGDWLSQFLALRDVAQFVVGASIQYTVNRETRDMRLQSSSARVRNAVLHAAENIHMPLHLLRMDLITSISEIFRIILPDTLNLARRDSLEMPVDEDGIDAVDSLCGRLNDRQVIQRMSDREMMHTISQITRNIELLDDPSSHSKTARPRLYALNCRSCHIAGDSQLRDVGKINVPLDLGEASEMSLPPHSKCVHCGEDVSIVREIELARHAWDLLKPLELPADTINVERHLPAQFQLAPPKFEAGISFHPAYSNVLGAGAHRAQGIEPSSPHHVRSIGLNLDGRRSISQTLVSPVSPGYHHRLDTPPTDPSPHDTLGSSSGGPTFETSKQAERRASSSAIEPPFSSDSVVSHIAGHHQLEASTSSVPFESTPFLRTPSIPVTAHEKGRPRWRSKLTISRKESVDSSSLSSTTLEGQRLEEISLKSLISASKISVRGKSVKNVNVSLSQNSTNALFWTQASIHLWDLGPSPPSVMRSISTESTCVLAAVTKVHLAYIIGTRDQKLTLRIVHLIQQSVPVIEYRMPSSLWCRSMTICPKENYVVVGFDNSTVRLFRTANSEQPREDRLHSRYHKECKECPPVDTLSFANDGLTLIASTRSSKSGMIQIYSWKFPFLTFQELPSCRYHVPLHESEDNGVTSAILRSGSGSEDDSVCITTWTQSGVPVLFQADGGFRSDIKTEISSHQGRLGNRIQCATFSPSGRELAMVNDRGHLYHVSNLNSSPMEMKRLATSKELTAKSDSFAMGYMILPDEEMLVLAWADSSKAIAYVKKIPIAFNIGDLSTPPTPGVVHVAPQSDGPCELPGDPRQPVELIAEEEPLPLKLMKEISK